MMRSLIPLLMFATMAAASPPAIEIPPEVKATSQYVDFEPKTDAASVTYVGLSGVDAVPTTRIVGGKGFVLDTRSLPADRYRFVAIAASKTGEQKRVDFVVIVGIPTPPIPPPTPKPVDPVDIVPIAPTGLHVLIVYESGDSSKLTAGQLSAINSGNVRDYLRMKCPTLHDGTTAWRIWDADSDTSKESTIWKEAFKRPRKSLPWILVTNPGKGGYDGPIPASEEAMLTLLKKYGGE